MHKFFQLRHSVRSYQGRGVEEEKLHEILEAANSAPSAGHLKAREVAIVKDLKVRQALARACNNQNFVAEAPMALVFFAVPARSAQKYGARGRDLYSLQDATIAAAFAWIQVVALGLSACWVGAFKENEIRKVLEMKDDRRPVAVLPIGYPAND